MSSPPSNEPICAPTKKTQHLVRGFAVIAASIGLHHTGIDGEAFALDQAGRHAGDNDAFKDVTKHIALPEPMEPVLREGRMMRDLVIEVEAAEPPVSQMQIDFLRQPKRSDRRP